MTHTSAMQKAREVESEPREWLLVKRDLYYRPDACGYTGIRDNAGRYTEAEAKAHVGDGGSGVTMIRESEAPEFTGACFDDLAREHLRKQRDALISETAAKDAEIERLKAEAAALRKALEPFATYLDQAAFDIDNKGRPFPDDQGMGWVYLTAGDFRRARDALTQEPGNAD